MMPRSASLLLICLAGCTEPSSLPKQLWLAPNQTEAVVQLIDHQPDPF
jgi:hypothetical protein